MTRRHAGPTKGAIRRHCAWRFRKRNNGVIEGGPLLPQARAATFAATDSSTER